MARVRSPAYPAHALPESIENIRKIHREERQNQIPREIAARHMGFAGISGTSDRAISALMHFGLAEKVMKGEIRVSDLALRILHPHDDEERRVALNQAGFNPELFQELRSRYPDRPPTAGTLESYLTRTGFAGAALAPAVKAYIGTCQFLQQEGAYESGVAATRPAPESAPTSLQEIRSMQPAPQPSLMLGTPHHGMPAHQPDAPSSMATDVFNLRGGGRVTITLPDTITERDYEDLKDWLLIMARKAKRAIGSTPEKANAIDLAAEIDKDDLDD